MRFLAFLNFSLRDRDGGLSTVADQGATPSIAPEIVAATIGAAGHAMSYPGGRRGGPDDGYQPF
jgi:hypothetical protein